MTSSVLDAPPVVKGAQRPRISCIPSFKASTGDEAIELAGNAGLELDDWQSYVLRASLAERPNGQWAAFQVAVELPRQNGKNTIAEARQLAGLFLLDDERLIIHSAHQFDTSLEHFRRIRTLVEDTPQLNRRLKPRGIQNAHGKEGIELKDGSRLRFRARTRSGGGRGFTSDLLFFDEAMDLPDTVHGNILPTLSARPNPQVWYMGSAVDQYQHDHGLVLARLRQRAIAGTAKRLVYVGWSLDLDSPDDVTEEIASDPENWALTNPGLGIRISPEYVADELESLDLRSFAVERLGVGDWPEPDGGYAVISADTWADLLDEASKREGAVAFALDVAPDRSTSSIGAAGHRSDGLEHIEVIERRRGTGWVVDYLVERVGKHKPIKLVVDPRGPGGSLIQDLEDAGLEVTPVTAGEYAQACGSFYDACDEAALRHIGQAELTTAVRGATKRPLGDAWAWSRNSSVDISPLVAVTLARWGLKGGQQMKASDYRWRQL